MLLGKKSRGGHATTKKSKGGRATTKKSRGGHATTKKSRGGHAKTKKENIVPLLHVRKKKHARLLIFLRCSYAAPFHFFLIFYNQNDKNLLLFLMLQVA